MSPVNRYRPLVISMGFNGYQWIWKRAATSHRAYCDRQNYDYIFVKRPHFTALLMECAWLKLPLLIGALSAGREWVLFIDCDTVISDDCPPLESVAETNKSLFMANGFSGRINSGVILVRNSPPVVALLNRIVANALSPLPPEDEVGWGENGHVIHYAKSFSGLRLLGSAWNNNQDHKLRDYIRHYSAGPMRQHYRFTPTEKLFAKIRSLHGRYWAKPQRTRATSDFFERLNSLMRVVAANYPEIHYIPITAAKPLSDPSRASGTAGSSSHDGSRFQVPIPELRPHRRDCPRKDIEFSI